MTRGGSCGYNSQETPVPGTDRTGCNTGHVLDSQVRDFNPSWYELGGPNSVLLP